MQKPCSPNMNSKYKYIIIAGIATFVLIILYMRNQMSLSNGSECFDVPSSEKSDCIRPDIDRLLNNGRVDAALTFLRQYQVNDKNYYGTDCHGIAHYIGDKAYLVYKKGGKINVGSDSGVCVYGFYHAFTSSFIANGEYETVRSFCSGISKDKFQEISGCYHGMGHGAIYDFYEKFGIRDPLTLINKGVALCEKLELPEEGALECVTGVYDGIGDEVLDPSYTGLTPEIIYSYCVDQPKVYKGKCYENISHLVFRKTQSGFENLLNFALKNVEHDYVADAVKGLATIYVVDLKGEDIRIGIRLCLPLKDDAKTGCIKNMVYKVMADVEDGTQFEKGKDFCSLDVFGEIDRSFCVRVTLDALTGFYSQNQIEEKCEADSSFFGAACKSKFL